MENKFIILAKYGISVEPAWWGDKNEPLLFDTEEDAEKYQMDDFEEDKRRQLYEVEIGERDPEDVISEPEDWVSPCTVDENGCICTPDDGLIYDPKAYVR